MAEQPESFLHFGRDGCDKGPSDRNSDEENEGHKGTKSEMSCITDSPNERQQPAAEGSQTPMMNE